MFCGYDIGECPSPDQCIFEGRCRKGKQLSTKSEHPKSEGYLNDDVRRQHGYEPLRPEEKTARLLATCAQAREEIKLEPDPMKRFAMGVFVSAVENLLKGPMKQSYLSALNELHKGGR